MAIPRTLNRTPFAVEPMFLADEDLRPTLTAVVKATFALSPEGELSLAAEQPRVNLAGERWSDGEEEASWRYEPESAFFKPATDVVLVGHAHAPAKGTRELLVSFRVGPLRKDLKVVGPRRWVKSMGAPEMTAPIPFEKIALGYENAFGGWDRSHPDPRQHQFEPRNPVGAGFRGPGGKLEDDLRIPNLESLAEPFEGWRHRPAPVGVGFVSPNWEPRVKLAGTYDEAWSKTRKPLLPKDFDRRFMNAASPGLVASGYLRGDEPVAIAHASPRPALHFQLPGLPPPKVIIRRTGNLDDAELETNLDTVIVDTDAMVLIQLWRGLFPLAREPAEVVELEVECPGSEKWGPPVDPDEDALEAAAAASATTPT